MAITPTPTVLIEGTPVECRAAYLDTAPIAMTGFTITWGRDEYMSAATSPASGTLRLLDTTGQWARDIRDGAALGKRVEIRWTGLTTDGSTVGPVTMFRGRVQHVTATPSHVRASDRRRAWDIELTIADRTADYGNTLFDQVEWPRDTMTARAVKIRDAGIAAGSEITAVYFWPGYVNSTTWPLDAQGTSALDLLAEFYASMGNDTYAYDPDENVIRQVIRLSQPTSAYLATFDDTTGWVLPVANDITVDGRVYPGVGLDGSELIGTPSIEATPATDINRLECAWKDQSTNFGDWTTIKEAVAPGDARRVLSWKSWLDDGVAIDPTLDNVWERAREEGRRPTHPEITIGPRTSFVSERMARWVLQTWANPRAAYISGDLPYLWLMADEPRYMPIVSPIGGTTSWDPKRGWAATLKVHWVHNSGSLPAPITWAAIEQIKTTTTASQDPWWWPLLGLPPSPPVTVGESLPNRWLRWGHPDDLDGYGFSPGVTWADMRSVDSANSQIRDVMK